MPVPTGGIWILPVLSRLMQLRLFIFDAVCQKFDEISGRLDDGACPVQASASFRRISARSRRI